MAQPLIDQGRLFRLDDAPMVRRPVYVVYRLNPADEETQKLALDGLREIAALEDE